MTAPRNSSAGPAERRTRSRFAWDERKRARLAALWPTGASTDDIARMLGCSRRAAYKQAVTDNLGPREPVARALWRGEVAPVHGVVTLPHVSIQHMPLHGGDDLCSPTTDIGPARCPSSNMLEVGQARLPGDVPAGGGRAPLGAPAMHFGGVER